MEQLPGMTEGTGKESGVTAIAAAVKVDNWITGLGNPFAARNNSRIIVINGTSSSSPELFHTVYLESLGDPDGNMSFFGTYFSVERITIETLLAVFAVVLNGASLGCITTSQRFSVYHTLFINLVIANILSAILSWISNNSMYLFQDQLFELFYTQRWCTALVYLSGAIFVQGSFGIISTLTLLGFSTAQYFAICKPLEHSSIVRRKKVILFMVTSWIIAGLVCTATYVTLIVISSKRQCTPEFQESVSTTINVGACTAIGICALIFCCVVCLFIRIHIEIKALQKRLSEIRFNQEVKSEKKAFLTTVILLTTLVIVFLPYSVTFLISLIHTDTNMQSNALIYYMTLLPYFKFISDPIIYGFRMRDIRKVCINVLLFCKCPCVKHQEMGRRSPISTTGYSHIRMRNTCNNSKYYAATSPTVTSTV